MKLRIMSDIHLEFTPFEPAAVDEDVVVLAGDIAPITAVNVPAWARRNFPRADVLWVLGNHEHYGTQLTVDEGIALAREQAAENEVILPEAGGEPGEWGHGRRVQLLEEDIFYSPWGVRFLGSTLWTDFELRNDRLSAMDIAERCMADFGGQIWDENEGARFTAEASREIHKRQVRWLEKELAVPYDGKTIVVTHHVPHPKCNHPAYAGSWLSPAFGSDLSWLIKRYQPDMWISGHTHASYRFNVGKTLLISNQRGYSDTPEQADAPFDPSLVVEI